MDPLKLRRVPLALLALLSAAAAGALASRTLFRERTTDPFAVFRMRVVPVLDRRCNACHGVSDQAYRALSAFDENATLLRWAVDDSARLATPEQVHLAYRRCTVATRTARRTLTPIDRRNPPQASLLARAPLAAAYSGYDRHPEAFTSPEDPDYRALLAWVAAERDAAPENHTRPSEAERVFAEQVTPILARKGCLGANCHGELAFNDLKLDAGIPALAERFTPEQHHANRLAMLGATTRLVHLGGDVSQSKQIRKIIPVEQGGIVHKGGNAFLSKGDPDYRALVRWLELEAAEARGRSGLTPGASRGLVFVRRPRATPERFFEDTAFLAGGDLYWRQDGHEVNLTAALHPHGPADIRAPDVSYDGSRVVFAMRRAAANPFDLWEVGLDSREARQLTFSEDPAVHFMDPLYVPDPEDVEGTRLARVALVFVSNRAGGESAASPDGVLGEAEGGTPEVIVDEQLSERAGSFDGRRVRIVRGANAGEGRRIVRQLPGRLVVDRPFARPPDGSTHYVIEAAPRHAPRFDAWRMRWAPPGKERISFEQTLTRMSYSIEQTRRPTLRSSGEPIFTFLRTGHQAGRPFFNGALFRTHVDGSNFHTHNGNRSGVLIHSDDRELANGLSARIGRHPDSWWGGALLLSDHQFGPTIEPDNPADDLDHPYQQLPPASALPRFVPGWISLDPLVRWRGISPGGAYRDPYPLPDGSLLAAFAPGPLDLGDPEAAPDFDIIRLTPEPAYQTPDGFGAGSLRREPVVGGPLAELWPRPVTPRLKEPVRKRLESAPELFGPPQESLAGRAYPDDTPAVLRLADLPLLSTFFEQITPTGERHVPTPVCPVCGRDTPELDQVQAVRLIEAHPDGRRFIIAELPLEDGSFYAAIPSRTAFDIQALNGLRMALRSPQRWLFAQPGERHTLSVPRALYAQTCGGCHGGLSGRPTDILRQPDAMTSATQTRSTWNVRDQLPRRPVNWSGAGPIPTTSVSYVSDVRPLIELRCARCHAGSGAAAGLELNGPRAYAALRGLTEPQDGPAMRSYLLEKLMGRELHAARPLSGDVPHPSRRRLSEAELLTLIRWIDLGAPWSNASSRDDSGSPQSPSVSSE